MWASDGGVDQASKLLRIMYTLELRKLQTTIDETVVSVQVMPWYCCPSSPSLHVSCSCLNKHTCAINALRAVMGCVGVHSQPSHGKFSWQSWSVMMSPSQAAQAYTATRHQ